MLKGFKTKNASHDLEWIRKCFKTFFSKNATIRQMPFGHASYSGTLFGNKVGKYPFRNVAF